MTAKKTLDLNTLIHVMNFDFPTKSFGMLRCSALKTGELAKLEEMIDAKAENLDIAKHLFATISHKRTGEEKVDLAAEGPLLTDDEVEAITLEELSKFCEIFVSHHSWIRTGDQKNPGTLVKESGEAGWDFLVRTFQNYREHQRNRFKKLTDQFSTDFFTKETLESIGKNARASLQLGSSIERLRAESMPTLKDFSLPRIPESPVFETNRKLEQLVAHIESMRPVVADCATMIESMNDTAIQMQANFMANSVKAEKQSRFATWFAAAGLFISVLAMTTSTVFSYVGLLDNRESGKRIEEQATLTSQTIKSLADSAKKDQASFIEALQEERRATFEAKNKASGASRQTATAKADGR